MEANAELDNITPQLRVHPDVLNLRWGVYAQARKWEAALDIAGALMRLAADDPMGYVRRSYALHELKRTVEDQWLSIGSACLNAPQADILYGPP